jgi:hypothetical protein
LNRAEQDGRNSSEDERIPRAPTHETGDDDNGDDYDDDAEE